MSHKHLSLLAATALVLSACATTVTAPVAPATKAAKVAAAVATKIAAAAKPVVTDLGHKDGAALSIDIAAAKTRFKEATGGGYKLQAVQHRWMTSDIKHYMVSLLEVNGDGSTTAVHEAVKVDVTTGNPAPLAAFTGLEPNKVYRVKLDAYGSNPDGETTMEIAHMNQLDNGNVVDFDFRENGAGNIEDAPEAKTVAVTLDPIPFSGNAKVNATVTEGQFTSKSRPTFVQPAQTQGTYNFSVTPDGNGNYNLTWNNQNVPTTFSAADVPGNWWNDTPFGVTLPTVGYVILLDGQGWTTTEGWDLSSSTANGWGNYNIGSYDHQPHTFDIYLFGHTHDGVTYPNAHWGAGPKVASFVATY